MSKKIGHDAGDVVDKTKQRRTIRVEKQQPPDSHGSARDVKHAKSAESAKVLMHVTNTRGQEYFAECGLRNAECRPRVFCGMWDAEKTCGMRCNLRNGKMRKSHLTAYKLSLASIATIYIPNTSSAVSASDILSSSSIFI